MSFSPSNYLDRLKEETKSIPSSQNYFRLIKELIKQDQEDLKANLEDARRSGNKDSIVRAEQALSDYAEGKYFSKYLRFLKDMDESEKESLERNRQGVHQREALSKSQKADIAKRKKQRELRETGEDSRQYNANVVDKIKELAGDQQLMGPDLLKKIKADKKEKVEDQVEMDLSAAREAMREFVSLVMEYDQKLDENTVARLGDFGGDLKSTISSIMVSFNDNRSLESFLDNFDEQAFKNMQAQAFCCEFLVEESQDTSLKKSSNLQNLRIRSSDITKKLAGALQGHRALSEPAVRLHQAVKVSHMDEFKFRVGQDFKAQSRWERFKTWANQILGIKSKSNRKGFGTVQISAIKQTPKEKANKGPTTDHQTGYQEKLTVK